MQAININLCLLNVYGCSLTVLRDQQIRESLLQGRDPQQCLQLQRADSRDREVGIISKYITNLMSHTWHHLCSHFWTFESISLQWSATNSQQMPTAANRDSRESSRQSQSLPREVFSHHHHFHHHHHHRPHHHHRHPHQINLQSWFMSARHYLATSINTRDHTNNKFKLPLLHAASS